MTKYILFFILCLLCFKGKAQNITINSSSTETYEGCHSQLKLVTSDKSYSKITITDKVITVYKLVNYHFLITTIPYTLVIKDDDTTAHYYGNQIEVLLDGKRNSITIIREKQVLASPQPLTIIPRKVWYTKKSKIIYYGVTL